MPGMYLFPNLPSSTRCIFHGIYSHLNALPKQSKGIVRDPVELIIITFVLSTQCNGLCMEICWLFVWSVDFVMVICVMINVSEQFAPIICNVYMFADDMIWQCMSVCVYDEFLFEKVLMEIYLYLNFICIKKYKCKLDFIVDILQFNTGFVTWLG